ncbi:inositol monophosphatase family protein [Klebsiella pneumoniae]|uniref:inositol monophosphatase family protein n=1 Tax=Pluralibacter gergoviae TaxID=61647 RepID=UPI002480AAA5|nr:inositol monophosphatase family protein [Klebsiella pneumoniae]
MKCLEIQGASLINDCYQHVMVAMGRIDAAIDTLMKPWDIAALIPCMREAGVACANINGIDTNLLYGGSLLTASSQSLLNELVVHLNGYPYSGVSKTDGC